MPSHMRLTNQTLDVRTLGGIFGRCVLNDNGGGVVATGTSGSIFLDDLGSAATSNITGGVTNADANLFGGRIPQGQTITIFGWQMQVFETDTNNLPVASAAQVVDGFLDSLSYKIFMKGQEYVQGNLKPVPSGAGASTLSRNGGANVDPYRFPSSLPIQLSPLDQWFVQVEAKRDIVVTGANNKIEIFLYCPASRGIALGQLSGA